MYLYRIVDMTNGKKYIGITNNMVKRWGNHCSKGSNTLISKAIREKGKENFRMELIAEVGSLEEASDLEIETIRNENTRIPYGYNVAYRGVYNKGGMGIDREGAKNSNAHLTEEEVRYIKSHRYIPEYVLYQEFSEKIRYGTFKDIYHDRTYRDVPPTCDPYPFNLEFSAQFSGSKGILDYEDIVHLRKLYSNGVYWKDALKEYKDVYKDDWTFWNVYYGNLYSLVMPEVFTPEMRKIHSGLAKSGEDNPKAKLTEDDVRTIRRMWSEGISRKEIQKVFSFVDRTTVNSVICGTTWKKVRI